MSVWPEVPGKDSTRHAAIVTGAEDKPRNYHQEGIEPAPVSSRQRFAVGGLLRLDLTRVEDAQLHRVVAPIAQAPDGARVEVHVREKQMWTASAVAVLREHLGRVQLTVVGSDPVTITTWTTVLRDGVTQW